MKVQFLSPHPDDIELYCGGALLQHAAAGDTIEVVAMTRGEGGALAGLVPGLKAHSRARVGRIRTDEMTRRLALVDGAGLVWLDFTDGAMSVSPAEQARVDAAVEAFAPDLIYLPETESSLSLRGHRDHLATARLGIAAARSLRSTVTLRFYHSRRPNCWIDVTDFHDASRAALRMHRHQYSAKALPPWLLHGLERWRRRWLARNGAFIQRRYAEAFFEQVVAAADRF